MIANSIDEYRVGERGVEKLMEIIIKEGYTMSVQARYREMKPESFESITQSLQNEDADFATLIDRNKEHLVSTILLGEIWTDLDVVLSQSVEAEQEAKKEKLGSFAIMGNEVNCFGTEDAYFNFIPNEEIKAINKYLKSLKISSLEGFEKFCENLDLPPDEDGLPAPPYMPLTELHKGVVSLLDFYQNCVDNGSWVLVSVV